MNNSTNAATTDLDTTDDEIRRCNPGAVKRVGMPLRVFLFEQRQVGCLEGIRLEVIEKLCTFYDQARHDPKVAGCGEGVSSCGMVGSGVLRCVV